MNKASYRSAAITETTAYHDESRRGFFAVLTGIGGPNIHQRNYSLRDLASVVDRFAGQNDVAISQAEFRRFGNRRITNLQSLGLNFADLETYRTRYAGMPPDQQARELLTHCAESGIPAPSLINSSGRGLHVKWPYDYPIPLQALPRWNAVQRYLGDRLKRFNPDPIARDGARCLRLVGTVNGRSGAIVNTVWRNENGGTIVRWPFEALAYEVLPISRADLQRARQERRTLTEAGEIARRQGGLNENLISFREVWLRRLVDIRTLAMLRGWQDGVPQGERHRVLLVVGLAAAWGANIRQPGALLAEIQSLSEEFTPDLPASEVHHVANYFSALVATGRLRRVRDDRLIEVLDISAEERRSLKWIRSSDERAETKRRQNRKECDRRKYLARAEANRIQALTLASDGATWNEIATALGTSRSSIARWLRVTAGTESIQALQPAYGIHHTDVTGPDTPSTDNRDEEAGQ